MSGMQSELVALGILQDCFLGAELLVPKPIETISKNGDKGIAAREAIWGIDILLVMNVTPNQTGGKRSVLSTSYNMTCLGLPNPGVCILMPTSVVATPTLLFKAYKAAFPDITTGQPAVTEVFSPTEKGVLIRSEIHPKIEDRVTAGARVLASRAIRRILARI